MFSWFLVILMMAISPPSASSSSSGNKSSEDKEFDPLKISKIAVGKKESELNLPTGYRFSPDDDELVLFYLFNKILDRVLPITDVIKEFDVYEHDPDQIPAGEYKHGLQCNEAFYFTNLQPMYSSEGKVITIDTNSGHWKVSGPEKEIKYGKSNVILGFKLSMFYNKGKPSAAAPRGSTISPYIMHQYRINPSIVPVDVLNDSIRAKIQRFVICRTVDKTRAKSTPSSEPETDVEPPAEWEPEDKNNI